MEEVKLKMEDLERWETLTNESSQSVDYRYIFQYYKAIRNSDFG